jgi:autotransporter family porin
MHLRRIATVTALGALVFAALGTFVISAATVEKSEFDRFSTLAPGSALPSGDACAARVRRDPWEPRPNNATPNTTKSAARVDIDGASKEFNGRYARRINGNFTGTTDEIIQWGACKWGFNVDTVRAQAAQESYWRQETLGDWNGREYLSYGLLQVKRSVHKGTYPASATSTAFNVDYALAWRRACFEGDFTWLNEPSKRGGYRAGDEWGCMGAWYSGDWYDPDAQRYLGKLRDYYTNRIWARSGF